MTLVCMTIAWHVQFCCMPLAMSYEQWTRVFKKLRWWNLPLACNLVPSSSSPPSNYSICKIARLANLQLFQGLHSHERRPLKMSKWQAWLCRTDLCLPILVETDSRQIFSRDRFETDFGHSPLLRGQISLLRSTSGWGPSPFTTIAFKPCIWAVTFWNTSKCTLYIECDPGCPGYSLDLSGYFCIIMNSPKNVGVSK